jgi:hypothetical protein
MFLQKIVSEILITHPFYFRMLLGVLESLVSVGSVVEDLLQETRTLVRICWILDQNHHKRNKKKVNK